MEKLPDIRYSFLGTAEPNPWIIPKKAIFVADRIGIKATGFMIDDAVLTPTKQQLPDEFFNHEISELASCTPERMREIILQHGILQAPLPLVNESNHSVHKIAKLNFEELYTDSITGEKVVAEDIRDTYELIKVDYDDLQYRVSDALLAASESDPIRHELMNDLHTASTMTYRITNQYFQNYPDKIIGTIVSFNEIRAIACELVHAANIVKWIGQHRSRDEILTLCDKHPLLDINGNTTHVLDPILRAFRFLEMLPIPTFQYRTQNLNDANKMSNDKNVDQRSGSLLEAVSLQLQSAATNGLAWHECAWCEKLFQVKRATNKEKTDRKRTEGVAYCCEKHRNSALQKAFRDRKRAQEVTE